MLPPMRADDPFLDRYAHGTRAMTASEIRALFAVASRPEVVSLAGGMPFTAALPFDVISEVASEVLAKEGPAALQYGGGQGDPCVGRGRGRHGRVAAGVGSARPDVLRPRGRDRRRGPVVCRRPLGLLAVPGRGPACTAGRRRSGSRCAR